jgi:peptidoglycan/xylan/chitin deacetylase (PgdA/CDA1 family)
VTARLPLLTFHAIDDRPSVISFSPAMFERGMARLHDAGYRTLSLLEAAEYVRRRQPFPERSFVITFDDGYQSFFEEAFPVLTRYGMHATVFLTVGEEQSIAPDTRLPSLSGPGMLSWREIREMQNAGIHFGAHTLTHPNLTRLTRKRVEAEIWKSKTIIE